MPSLPPPATASADLADDVYRTASLGFYIHGEEVKTQEIIGRDGHPAITYHKDSDGLFSIRQIMPNGATEYWKQTDLMMNAETGVKVMAYERRNADGSVYVGANGRPQALIESVGTINTNQDIRANTKIVEGRDAHELFDKARDFGETWYQHARQRSEANGLAMPDVVVGAHSMGAFTVGAITLKLHEHGIEPTRTIEIEPVGAGAGVEYLAGHYHANATPQQREQIAHFLATNVSSFRAAGQSGLPGSLFQLPGGWREHANDMVGNTYEYAGTSDTAWLMTNHKLAVPANDINRNGPAALRRTPEHDTPVSAFLNDARLSFSEQYTADNLLDAFNVFTVASRGHGPGDTNTVRTDLHAGPAPVEAGLHQQNVRDRTPRSYATMKTPLPVTAVSAQEDVKQSSKADGTSKKAGNPERTPVFHSPGV